MKTEKSNITSPYQLFILLFIIHFLIGVVILFFFKRGDVVLWVNSFSSIHIDPIMPIITYLGHGVFALIISVLFLFRKIYNAFLLGLTFLFVSLFTNLMKHFIFVQHNRPLWNFYYDDLFRVIYEAPINYLRSFPSGHTMTAFALATVFSMFIKNKLIVFIIYFYAILIAFSRIYLLQHYFIDVFWGSVFGVFAAIVGKFILDKLIAWFKIDFMKYSIQKLFFQIKQ